MLYMNHILFYNAEVVTNEGKLVRNSLETVRQLSHECGFCWLTSSVLNLLVVATSYRSIVSTLFLFTRHK